MFNLSLLTPGVAVFLTLLTTFAGTYLFGRRPPYTRRLYSFTAAACLTISLILVVALRALFTSNELPSNLFVLTLPFSIALMLAYICWHNSHFVKLLAVVNILLGILLSLTFVNAYYHYYPTLGSVVGVDPTTIEGTNTLNTHINSVSTHAHAASSIESALYGASKDQTYAGTINKVNISGPLSRFKARSAYVYRPYISTQNPSLDLPVLLLLPGYPSFNGAADWTEGIDLQGVMDRFARNHRGITPLVVAVDSTGSPTNDTECVDSPRGNVETYLTKDVPNYIKSHYSVSYNPQQWGIGGLSMGGMCSAMLALKHPDTFRYFLDFSGEIGPEVGSKAATITKLFGGSEAQWRASQINLLLDDTHRYPIMGGYFLHGTGDAYTVNNAVNQAYLDAKKRGFDVVNESLTGKHTFELFKQDLVDALPWMSNRLGATNCVSSCSSAQP